ncbi:hypothetical protein EDM52_20805 [Brevibacillus invocatus]|uniref:Uncharacterized protein n=1 Tax=Brevibacillus invocatus TaxID=173959 RepID=A0A3M8BXY0_9BACL|nr:hypothetical protein [Brevibacillus invocatus]RNB68288.1 hypothetical protein EDM52_20805 [Brevibacillus invocatus]
MQDEFYPKINPDATIASPDGSTQGEVLDRQRFRDLYELSEAQGLPYFARMDAEGHVELFLVFESVDAFSEQTKDAVSLEYKTYQQKLLAVIWTLSDPMQPLGFPLSFDIQKAEDRYMALQMLEQPHTSLHYLAYEEGALTHIYTEEIYLSAAEVTRVQQMIRALYEGKADSLPDDAVVEEEESKTIPAICLPDSVLQETGIAYVIDHHQLGVERGEEAAHHLLMSTVQQAVWVIRRHSRSEVREAAFTVWAAERMDMIYLVVTPTLDDLFEVVHQSDEELNPFARFMMMLPEFAQSEEVHPLQLGAFPILRYESGRLYHLEIDAHTQEHLARLFEKSARAGQNPYFLDDE